MLSVRALLVPILTTQFSIQRYVHGVISLIVLAAVVRPVWASPDDCRVEADADILGLGVRLGIYFQLTSNVCIAFIHPKEAAGSLQINNMFMTALFVSLLYSTVQNDLPSGAIVCALWFVVLDLPVIIPTIISAAVRSPSGIVLSFWTVSMTLLRFVAFNVYNTWFWFHGLDIQNETQCQEPRVFFFANLSALGRIRTYYKVNMVLNCMLGSLIVLIIWLFAFLRVSLETRQNRWVYRLKSDHDNSLGAFAVGTFIVSIIFGLYGFVFYFLVGAQVLLMQTGVPIARRILWATLCGVVLLALFIIPMELQISWNKLDGVEGIASTGQLISLTVGSFSLIRTVFLTGMGDSEEGDSVQNGERDLESRGSERPETVVPEIATEAQKGKNSASRAQASTLAPTTEIGVRAGKRKTL
jgi:hypothetical protein